MLLFCFISVMIPEILVFFSRKYPKNLQLSLYSRNNTSLPVINLTKIMLSSSLKVFGHKDTKTQQQRISK